jgi:hypothetical protein
MSVPAVDAQRRRAISAESQMKAIKLLVAGIAIVLSMNPPAHAQGVTDMAKLTCAQLLQGSANAIESAIWLSGYYNGLRKNTKLDLDRFHKNADAVITECNNDPRKTVMQTINTLMSRKK